MILRFRRLAAPALLALLLGASPASAVDVPASAALVELNPAAGEPLSALLAGTVDRPFRLVDVDLAELMGGGLVPWAVLEPARLTPCQAEPRSAAELEAELADVEGRLFELDYEGTDEGLHALSESLCGCTEALPPTLASRITYLQGVVRFYAGEREAARELFGLAAQLQPEIEWDTAFPPRRSTGVPAGAGGRGPSAGNPPGVARPRSWSTGPSPAGMPPCCWSRIRPALAAAGGTARVESGRLFTCWTIQACAAPGDSKRWGRASSAVARRWRCSEPRWRSIIGNRPKS